MVIVLAVHFGFNFGKKSFDANNIVAVVSVVFVVDVVLVLVIVVVVVVVVLLVLADHIILSCGQMCLRLL